MDPDENGNMPREYGYSHYEQACQRARTVPGTVRVYEFENDAEARMFLDSACAGFRNTVLSSRA